MAPSFRVARQMGPGGVTRRSFSTTKSLFSRLAPQGHFLRGTWPHLARNATMFIVLTDPSNSYCYFAVLIGLKRGGGQAFPFLFSPFYFLERAFCKNSIS